MCKQYVRKKGFRLDRLQGTALAIIVLFWRSEVQNVTHFKCFVIPEISKCLDTPGDSLIPSPIEVCVREQNTALLMVQEDL